MTEISLSEAADRIIDIETEAPFPKGTVHLFDNFDDPPLAAWFLPRDKTANARLYDLSDVVFDTHFQVLMKNGRRIPESRYMTSVDEYAVVAEAPERQITNDSAECLIIASNRSSNNYYHWMVQTLPGIDWAARTSRSGQIAIFARPLSTWQRDSLALLGLSGVPVIAQEAARQYRLHRAQFNDFVAGVMTYQVSRAIGATFRRMAAQVPASGQTAPAVYVARTDSPYRALLNEAEVIAALEREGIHIVVPSEHSLAEQIQIFRAARLVIGPHGAGMSNIGFCQPGTVVYEILPRHFPNACFDFLAQSAGLRYYAAVFGGPLTGNPLEQSWSVSLGPFLDHLAVVRGATGL